MLAATATAQSLDQIRKYQEMLIWTGDYDGIIDGDLGNGTISAIKQFQARLRHTATGRLTRQEAEFLIEQGTARKRAVGFEAVNDDLTGVSFGIPHKLVSPPLRTRWGMNWAASDDRINIDSLRFSGIELRDLFEKLTNPTYRRVDYSASRDNWFVVSGIDRDGSEFYVRAEQLSSEIRGFSVRIEKEWRTALHPIPLAMSSSFRSNLQDAAGPVVVTPTKPHREPTIPAPNPPPNPLPADCFNGLGCGIAAFRAR